LVFWEGWDRKQPSFFYQKIIKLTPAQKDQDHIATLIYSNPKIPDRTQSILNNQPEKAASSLEQSARILEAGGASFIVIPCNTAHFWIDQIRQAVTIPVLDMIEETALYLIQDIGLTKVGLLATLGTIRANVYQEKCEKLSLEIITPTDEIQQQVMNVILEIKKGNKGETLQEQIVRIRESFQEKGIQKLILGCTELPLLFDKQTEWAIDPMDVLAKAAVKKALNL